MALPEPSTVLRPGVVRIDRIGLELGKESKLTFQVEGDSPLSAVPERLRTDTISRDTWRVRIETLTRLSCTKDAFLLRATLRVQEGPHEVCHREWDRSIPRDFCETWAPPAVLERPARPDGMDACDPHQSNTTWRRSMRAIVLEKFGGLR